MAYVLEVTKAEKSLGTRLFLSYSGAVDFAVELMGRLLDGTEQDTIDAIQAHGELRQQGCGVFKGQCFEITEQTTTKG